jgi:hypothetical protein
VTDLMRDREVAELRAALEVARRDEADAAVRAKVAEARVEVLRTALGEASDMCAQEYSVDNQRSMDRVMKILSLALYPARAALGVERGTE